MSLAQGPKKKDKRILSGTCPEPQCQARLFFPAAGPASIECTECGRRHETRGLLGVEEVTDPDVVLHNLLRSALLGAAAGGPPPRRGPEPGRVLGLSNYHCKLLSPVLTRYGMDKQSGKARPLRDMNQGDMFDCSLLGDRAFLIEPEHVGTAGYGRDRSGSLVYLHDTLEEVKRANGGRECLVPVHVDGDGHCLVHAVSRALVGRELFWHALRENLKRHFELHLERYRALFQDFIHAAEWADIVSECDPLFVPPEGVPLGLRNIHIFGLANVLHRPIVLLDSLSGMRSSGDYSATFLPGLVPEERCRGRDGAPNRPICIAWSSSSRNHYIPLVGVRSGPPPRLPAHLLPKAWGVPQELIGRYVRAEADGGVEIGGERGLQDAYLLRLVRAMEEVFAERHGVHAALVADVHQYVYRRTGLVGVQPEEVTEAARRAVAERRLHRCLACGALSELQVPPDWLLPGGKLYELARSTHGALRPDKNYSFPLSSVVCSYDPRADALAPDYRLSSPASCAWCRGAAVRHVRADGSPVLLDGDRTATRSAAGKCGCGFKHFWEGREYDNLPEAVPVTLEWAGRQVRETVFWFQHEAEPELNSNAYDVATRLVAKHFPGEFGSEVLVQKVVNTILHHTARRGPDEYHPVSVEGAHAPRFSDGDLPPNVDPPTKDPPTKIILTGQKAKTLHREELTMSRAERGVQQSVSEQAPLAQRRRTDRLRQEERRAEERRAEERRAADKMAADQRAPNQIAADQRAQNQMAPNEVAPDQKAPNQMAPDQKAPNQMAQNQVAPDQKAPNQMAANHMAPDQRAPGRADSPGGSPDASSSAPATPTRASPSSSGREKKLRVTTSDGRQATLTLPPRTTFSELRRHIGAHFGVPPAMQVIRYGFPPRELAPPADGEENEPVALQHGDRVTVEILRGPEDRGPAAPVTTATSSHAVRGEEGAASGRASGRELQESIDLEMSSLCLLATLMGEDVWSYAKKLPHLFQQGGVFYNIVKKDMGLMDGKHCTLPHLSGKTFVYNAAERRLELCVDAAGHFPVGAGVDEQVREALQRPASREGSPAHAAHGGLRLGAGGAVRKKEQLPGVAAFQGRGHSLGGASPPEHRPITRQHSSGVDLSASVSLGAPDLSGVPADATRELVRMAPGFVTTRDGAGGVGGVDPALMEQQRRKLQEMVSSIQASMERHLREQGAAGGGAKAGTPPPAAAVATPAKPEDLEQMESQEAGPSGAAEPMDHS